MNAQRLFSCKCWHVLAMTIAVACLIVIGYTQPVQPLNQADLAARALQVASTQMQVALPHLVIADMTRLDYPTLGVQTYTYKILDNRTGAMQLVTLDSQGQIPNEQALSAAENQASFTQYGRMDIPLAEHLASLPPNAEEEVIIWVKEPPYEPLPVPTPDEIRTLDDLHRYQARVYEHRSNFVRGVTAETVWKLQSIGYLVEANKAVPVISARLPVGLIKELSRDTFNWPEVERLYKPVEMQALIDVSRRTVMADVTHFRNIEGFGVRVGIVEARAQPGGGIASGRVAAGFTGANAVNNNPYLFGTTVNTTNLGAGSGAHATEVAGVIRMLDINDEVFRGISPWASLWAGGGTSYADLTTAITNAIGNGGGQGNSSVVNMSYGTVETQGTPGSHSRYADTTVFSALRTLVVAAGNSGADAVVANRRVNMPGDAYNVITVGNLDDQGTVRWNDDSIHPTSSFGLATARMKPELVAPGTNIRTTSIAAPWNNDVVTGTSFAAPHVTGTAALMIEARPYVGAWPELIKAILMCNALHNVTNAPGTRAATGCLITNQSVEHAKNTNANMGWATGYVGADCNGPPGGDWNFNLNAGQRLRFVLCWPQNPSWGPTDANGYAARPSADYDLRLYRVADNQLVASSLSVLNNFEIIDYTIPANQGGQYRVEIRTFRCGDAAIANNATTRSPGRRRSPIASTPKTSPTWRQRSRMQMFTC